MLIPLILCGGTGSRLWPLSKEEFPKQFLKLVGNNSLIEQTISRVKTLENAGPTFLSSSLAYEKMLLNELGNKNDIKYIFEPTLKGTGPAILTASFLLNKLYDDPILLILPSDHYLEDAENFCSLVKNNSKLVDKNWITFGVKPSNENTNYGYIRVFESKDKLKKVKSFIEKPNLSKAKKLIKDHSIYWNSGIFMAKASFIIEEFNRFSKTSFQLGSEINSILESENKGKFYLDLNLYSKFKENSIDYEILEKSKNINLLELNSIWSDLGSWDSLSDIFLKDNEGNSSNTNFISENSKNNFFYSDTKEAALVDIKDTIIVNDKDSLLIIKKGSSEKVKEISKKFKKIERPKINVIGHEKRPWGEFETLYKSKEVHIKKIIVNPKSKLSLQSHKYRAENWIVLKGQALVTKGEEEIKLSQNESVFINIGEKHRLENNTNKELIILECQTGSYFGEDDIERFEDDFGRIEKKK